MFLMILLMGLAMDCKAERVFAILAYFHCSLRRKEPGSRNILLRAYKTVLEVFVRGTVVYIKRRASRSVVI